MKTFNLVLAFLLELAMLAAWAWKGASLPIPAPWPGFAAAAFPLAVIVLWGLFASPRARFPMGRTKTGAFKAAFLGGGAWALASAGLFWWGLADGILVAANLVLAVAWGQFGPSDREVRLRKSLGALLDGYLACHPDEAEVVARFREFLDSGEALQGKTNSRRHVTASAWVVNPGRTRVLLTHHAKLDLWVQLGGHTDEGEDWAAAALREAREESGLTDVRLVSGELFDLDVHTIPARADTPAHDHYDLRFLAEADDGRPFTVSDESHDLAWVALTDLGRYTTEASQHRMATRT